MGETTLSPMELWKMMQQQQLETIKAQTELAEVTSKRQLEAARVEAETKLKLDQQRWDFEYKKKQLEEKGKEDRLKLQHKHEKDLAESNKEKELDPFEKSAIAALNTLSKSAAPEKSAPAKGAYNGALAPNFVKEKKEKAGGDKSDKDSGDVETVAERLALAEAEVRSQMQGSSSKKSATKTSGAQRKQKPDHGKEEKAPEWTGSVLVWPKLMFAPRCHGELKCKEKCKELAAVKLTSDNPMEEIAALLNKNETIQRKVMVAIKVKNNQKEAAASVCFAQPTTMQEWHTVFKKKTPIVIRLITEKVAEPAQGAEAETADNIDDPAEQGEDASQRKRPQTDVDEADDNDSDFNPETEDQSDSDTANSTKQKERKSPPRKKQKKTPSREGQSDAEANISPENNSL